MKLAQLWQDALEETACPLFSPSGHALALMPLFGEPTMRVLEVRFAGGGRRRATLSFVVGEEDTIISPVAWASDAELVYWVSGHPLGERSSPTLWALSVEDGTSRPIRDLGDGFDPMSAVYSGVPGHLSVLAEPKGEKGLFDLDVSTGEMRRLPAFDAALSRLDVYPLFGHSWCPQRQEAALVAWPHGDYLPEGVEPTQHNSQWLPILDEPSIQDEVLVRPDGTRMTQREVAQEARRMTPFRLFLLDASGACAEVPNTHKAHRPRWSPDGSLLAFQRYEHSDPQRKAGGGSPEGAWLLRRSDLSPTRLGGCSASRSTLMHPSGVLLCHLEDESIPADADRGRARARSARWAGFAVRGGAVTPE
jgi:hypothetical protein